VLWPSAFEEKNDSTLSPETQNLKKYSLKKNIIFVFFAKNPFSQKVHVSSQTAPKNRKS